MGNFHDKITRIAQGAVAKAESRGGGLDYSEGSLNVVDAMLAEAAAFSWGMPHEQTQALTEEFGCYVLEVGLRGVGGRYGWHQQRQEPVLIVGEPAFRVGTLTWDIVRRRLSGDPSISIPRFYEGFSQRAKTAEPGDEVLHG